MVRWWKSGPKPGPLSSGKRSLLFWTGRILVVAAATTLIVLAIVWWRDRPLVMAEASLEQGDLKYAHYLLARFLDDHPHHPRAMALQARVYVAIGDPHAAVALFEQAGGSTIEDLRAWARALLMTQQWSLAMPLLERVVQGEPENPDALYELTACRVRLGMFEEALESARRYARLPGQEARGHLFMGAILRDLGKDAEAAAAYQVVLQHDPEAKSLQSPPAEFFLQYGQTLLKLGKPEASLDPLKHSAAAQETPEVLLELGNAALQLARPEDAKTAWKRALVHDERNVLAREALARAELAQGKADEALQWLAPLPEQAATLETAFLRQRAYTLLHQDDQARQWQDKAAALRKKQEFQSEIETLLRDSPQSFWARVVRTHRFAEQGNWRQAELLAEMLMREAPAEPFVIELASAVHRRRDLPALESMPITHH